MSRLLDDDEIAAIRDLFDSAAESYERIDNGDDMDQWCAHDADLILSAGPKLLRHIAELAAQLEGEKAEGDRLAAAVTAAVTSYRGVVQRG